MRIELNTPLSTTLQLPCIAQQRYTVESIEDFPALMQALDGAPFKVLGGGSNVLCAACTVQTVVQVAIKGIELIASTAESYFVQVGAGENWHHTVMHTINSGWAGLENLALIPGWVGAAPVQNIGAYGVELSDRLFSVQAWDTHTHSMVSLNTEQCHFGYRDSVFKQNAGRYLISSVAFKLPRPWQPVITYAELAKLFTNQNPSALSIANAVIAIRQRKLPDPAEIPNAGSFFKNPIVCDAHASALKAKHPSVPVYPVAKELGKDVSKLAAGWLIEHAGWKGREILTPSGGRVGTHVSQALVLVHLGGAIGEELLQFAQQIQDSVHAKFGILLEREVNVWN